MPSQVNEVQVPDDSAEETPTVTAHKSHTERTVFTEHGNNEAWIATDLTIERWL